MKIGILGGSFDPIHNAHIALAETAYSEFALDEIYLIPNSKTYYKERKSGTSDEERLEMTRLAVSDRKHFIVSDIEIKRGGITYTIDTIRYFRKSFNNSEIYFIIGGDSLSYLETWKEADSLFQETIFLAAVRDSFDKEKSEMIISDIKSRYPYSDIRLIDMPSMEISSTDIRNKVKNGYDISDMVPDKVRRYISDHGLYK